MLIVMNYIPYEGMQGRFLIKYSEYIYLLLQGYRIKNAV